MLHLVRVRPTWTADSQTAITTSWCTLPGDDEEEEGAGPMDRYSQHGVGEEEEEQEQEEMLEAGGSDMMQDGTEDGGGYAAAAPQLHQALTARLGMEAAELATLRSDLFGHTRAQPIFMCAFLNRHAKP